MKPKFTSKFETESGKRSGFEDEVVDCINSLEHPLKWEYETELLEYFTPKFYKPDFIIRTKPNDIYIEAKGWLTPQDRTKLIAVKEAHPDIDLRLWFQRDNWVTTKKKQRYSDWAKRNGFKYAVWPELPFKLDKKGKPT
jgi:predicted nuclease of restriction endonuclease-like RecB superfamily